MVSSGKIEELKDQLMAEKVTQYNRDAIMELIQEWCVHVAENMTLTRGAIPVTQLPTPEKKVAIVVGAAPELTDNEILALTDFAGDIIITNKNWKRFFDLGVVPDWVCLLDAHPISKTQFDWMYKECEHFEKLDEYRDRVKFLVASVVYPPTLRKITRYSKQVYMFNPVSEDLGGPLRLSKTWEWLNYMPEMEHGGSVGCTAVTLAKKLHYSIVGLLGFGLYERPSPKWTMEDVKKREYEYFYYPDTNDFIALPLNFTSYISHITFEVMDSGAWARYYNLSDSPVLRHNPVFKQSNVYEFVRDHEAFLQEFEKDVDTPTDH